MLAAALRRERGEAHLALSELATQRDPRLLPEGIDDGLRFGCYANRWREHETLSASITADLAIGGEAEGSLTIGPRNATCWLRFELLEPTPENAVGEREIALGLRWAIRLGDEHREGITQLRARALVEGGEVAILELIGSDAEPDAQHLRTTLLGDRVEVHVGLTREH